MDAGAIEVCTSAVDRAREMGYRVVGIEVGGPVWKLVFGCPYEPGATLFGLPVTVDDRRGMWATAIVQLGSRVWWLPDVT